MNIDYGILPEHLREQARRYIEEGIRPGALLEAAFSDWLSDAFEESKDDKELGAVARFVATEAPNDCWGSLSHQRKWMASFRPGGSRCPATGKRCKGATSMTYLGASLCQQHWELLCEWIEKLEAAGAPLTAEQFDTLLGHSIRRKRGDVWPQRIQ